MSGRHKQLTQSLQTGKLCKYCNRPTGSAQVTCKDPRCRLKSMRDCIPTAGHFIDAMNLNAVYGKMGPVVYLDTDSAIIDDREVIDTTGETVE